uniref:Uncharacterized protein n=1 Tax=Rhizophora mucronata TaxID=61149 RepID=A0A2P2QCV9_RHIMU
MNPWFQALEKETGFEDHELSQQYWKTMNLWPRIVGSTKKHMMVPSSLSS